MNNYLLNKNIICFDVGTKKVGIATGNNIIKITHPIKTLNTSNIDFWKNIKNIVLDLNPYLFIIGFPKNIYEFKNNKIQNEIKNFYVKLKFYFKIKIILKDESFTTSESRIFLKENKDIFYKYKNNNIHSISAAIILRDWFLENNI